MSNKLINERPLLVLPSLVLVVGMERAIALQQLHFILHSDSRFVECRDSKVWVELSYAKWHKWSFPFWKPETIRKLFSRMRDDGLLIHQQFNLASGDATSYVTIDYDKLKEIVNHPDFDAGYHPDFDAEEHPDFDAASTIGKKRNKGEKRARTTRAPDSRTQHPAIQLIRELRGTFPPKANYDDLIAALGDSPDRVKATACYKAWTARGHKPTNLAPFLEWYATGIPKPGANANANAKHKPNERNEPAGFAAIREYAAQNGLTFEGVGDGN